MTRLFCFICKRHVEFDANETEARKRFHASGHDDRKVSRTLRGPVGYYKTQGQLERERAAAAAKKEAALDAED